VEWPGLASAAGRSPGGQGTNLEEEDMTYVLLKHTVADYGEFKAIYDADAPHRLRRGSKGARLFRSLDEPNLLFMLFEWDDAEKARKFAQGYELYEAMEWASVIGNSEIHVIEEVEDSDA
jgi:hypothetical protein